MVYKYIHYRLLERGRHVCLINSFTLHFTGIQIIQYGGFKTTEAEIILCLCHLCPGEMNSFRIPLLCHLINLRSSGISKADRPRHLVKGFSCRIIPGTSKDLIFPIILHYDQMRMPAGYHKTYKGRLQFFILYVICADMSFNMMHTNKWDPCGKADRFGCGNSNK